MLRKKILPGIMLAALAAFLPCPSRCAAQEPSLSQEVERNVQRESRRGRDPFQGKTPPPGTVSIIGRSFVKSVADGRGNIGPLLGAVGDKNLRDDLGLSDEQTAKLKVIRDEMRGQMMVKGGQYALRFNNMTEADYGQIEQDISGELKELEAKVLAVVTPEQVQKSRTLVFQATGGIDSPFGNVDTLSTLNLTDEQKEQTRKTMAAMDKERLELLEDGLKLAEKVVAAGGPRMSKEDRERLEKEIRLFENRVYESGKKLGDSIRPLLTEEQKTLATRLMANRPKYLPPLPRRFRARLGEETDYVPGSDSWQPGQGAPEETGEPKRPRLFPSRPTGS